MTTFDGNMFYEIRFKLVLIELSLQQIIKHKIKHGTAGRTV